MNLELSVGDQFNWHDDPAPSPGPDVEILKIYEDEDGHEQVRIEDLGSETTVTREDVEEALETNRLRRVNDE